MNELQDDITELYELTVKLARRCTYDLRHIVECSSSEFKDLYMPRLKNYETIFEAATGTKDYRHRLHRRISELEFKVKELQELLVKSGVTLPEDDPF